MIKVFSSLLVSALKLQLWEPVITMGSEVVAARSTTAYLW